MQVGDVFCLKPGTLVIRATGNETLTEDKWCVAVEVQGGLVLASELWDHNYSPIAPVLQFLISSVPSLAPTRRMQKVVTVAFYPISPTV